jgi:hypothetical protein
MKNLIYLFVAVIMFAFTACGGGEAPAEAAEEVVAETPVAEEVATEEVVEDTTAEDTTAEEVTE